MQTPQQQLIQLAQPALCQICGHARTEHFRMLEGKEYALPCTHEMGSTMGHSFDCKCAQFCAEFKSKETSLTGLECVCGIQAFQHKKLYDQIAAVVMNSQVAKIAHMDPMAVPYKVLHGGSKICCLWTVYHHMRTTKDVKVMIPGYAIECPMCQRVGRMAVVADSFVLGPTWKWEYKRS